MIRGTHTPVTRRVIGASVAVALALTLAGCGAIGSLLGGGDDPFSIKVGECFNERDFNSEQEEIESVQKVDCSESHELEATKSIILEGETRPADSVLMAQADDECFTAFEEYVGGSYDSEGVYEPTYYFPSVRSWAEGDREILCLLYGYDGPTTGSAKDTAR
ncbi:MAG: septum formation family protein [Cryobacterium sp.]|nr:septum formation family protein [Cryobacterium sp.]